jgi:hypothetical protein
MTEPVPPEGPPPGPEPGGSEIIEGPTPAGGVKLLLLKDATGEIREAQEIDADGKVIERTYFPPSSLDK